MAIPSNVPASWPEPRDVHTIVFDFDGVFTNNKVYVSETGEEHVRCDRGDGYGFNLLRSYLRLQKLEIDTFILSTEKNGVVLKRAEKLKLPCHSGVGDKLAFLTAHLRATQKDNPEPFRNLVYLGNDLNDLPVIELAGFSVAPGDAHALVRARASCVMANRGGDGFIRAFVEKFISLDKLPWGALRELILNC